MRLGGPVHGQWEGPAAWVAAVRNAGYGAAYCPVGPDSDRATRQALVKAATEAGIVIAEVGAWCNPLSPDQRKAEEAHRKCVVSLALADEVGARCCVNIAGSLAEGQDGAAWHGPHARDLSDEGFDRVVQSVRRIIDEARPTRTFYTLETMPWMYPDSVDSYVRLVQAIARPRFAVHLDPVNLVNCPRLAFDTTGMLRECFARLGPWIRSCHAKDIALDSNLTLHLSEVRPGLGRLCYRTFLRELDRLDDVPLMLEHLPADQYPAAADYIRKVAIEEGIRL